MSELFRLIEDEANLVHVYRLLDDDFKAAVTALATQLAETSTAEHANVYPFIPRLKQA